MPFYRIILFSIFAALLAVNSAEAARDIYGNRYGLRPVAHPDKKMEDKKSSRTGTNLGLENAMKSPAGSNVGLTTGFHGNIGLGATPQSLNPKPSDNSHLSNIDDWKRRNYGRRPVRFHEVNPIDPQDNVHFRADDPSLSPEDNPRP